MYIIKVSSWDKCKNDEKKKAHGCCAIQYNVFAIFFYACDEGRKGKS